MENKSSKIRKSSILTSDANDSRVSTTPYAMSRQIVSFSRLINIKSIKTLTGVRGWPVSIRVITDSRIGIEVYSKAAKLERMALFVRMMLISRLKETKRLSIILIIYHINQERSFKYLGVVVDESLSWNSHMSYVASRVYPKLKLLNRFSSFLDCGFNIRDPALGGFPFVLERLQNKALRIILRQTIWLALKGWETN